jgi:hypothetical protein
MSCGDRKSDKNGRDSSGVGPILRISSRIPVIKARGRAYGIPIAR